MKNNGKEIKTIKLKFVPDNNRYNFHKNCDHLKECNSAMKRQQNSCIKRTQRDEALFEELSQCYSPYCGDDAQILFEKNVLNYWYNVEPLNCCCWTNTGLNLSKSTQLVRLFIRLWYWYELENINVTLKFEIDHGHTEISKHKCAKTLKKEKWIRVIIKAMKYVFKINDNSDLYPFDDEKKLPQEISLIDRVSITLCEPEKVFGVIRKSSLYIKLVTK